MCKNKKNDINQINYIAVKFGIDRYTLGHYIHSLKSKGMRGDDNLLFLEDLLDIEGQKAQIMLDTSHLVKKPMDITKAGFNDIKSVLSQPYALMGIVFLVFILTGNYMLKTGGSIGRKS